MKNQFLILIPFMLLPLFIQAQSEYGPEKTTRLGFTASPTFGWLSYSSQTGDTESNGLRTGFSYGIIGDFGFTPNYFFSTALTVTTVNANTKSPTFNSIYKLQYLELPLTLKLKSNEQQTGKFYGQFGLATGIKLSAKRNRAENPMSGSNGENLDISDEINTFRLGLIIGGGAEWKLQQNLSLLTGISYNNGFTDVLDTEEKAKNSYIVLNLGVFF